MADTPPPNDRYGALRFVTLGLVAMGMIAGVDGWLGGQVISATVVFVGIAAVLFNLASAGATESSVHAASWRFCWILFAVVSASAIGQGGLYDPDFSWLYLLPLVGLLLVGPRAAWVFTGLVLLYIVVLWSVLWSGVNLAPEIPVADLSRTALLTRITAVLSIGICLAALNRRDLRIRGVLCAANDTLRGRVEEQKTLHTRLMRAERLATVGELSATVAHEINNPLTYLMTNLELLERFTEDLPASERVRYLEMLADALDGAERVRAIVANLKETTRESTLDALEPVALPDVIDRAVKLVGQLLSNRARVEIVADTAPQALGHTGRLIQVLVNLLANAAQAMPDGTPETHAVRIRAWGEVSRVVIEIADDGTGISTELAARVFEPFFTTKRGTGTGLGLSVTRSLVEQMGGTIMAESSDHGAVFRVHLQRASPPIPKGTPASGLRVLAIDDEPLILNAIRRALPEHRVTIEPSSLRGLQRAIDEDWDAIVCDLMMPQLSGQELFQKLESVAPAKAAKVVFITGAALGTPEQAFVDRPDLTVLGKPIDIRELESALTAVARLE